MLEACLIAQLRSKGPIVCWPEELQAAEAYRDRVEITRHAEGFLEFKLRDNTDSSTDE